MKTHLHLDRAAFAIQARAWLLYSLQVVDVIPSASFYLAWSGQGIWGYLQAAINVIVIQAAALYVAWEYKRRQLFNLRARLLVEAGEHIGLQPMRSVGVALCITVTMEVVHLLTFFGRHIATDPGSARYITAWLDYLGPVAILLFSVVMPVFAVILTFVTTEEVVLREEEEIVGSIIGQHLRNILLRIVPTPATPQPPNTTRKRGRAPTGGYARFLEATRQLGWSTDHILQEYTVERIMKEYGVARRTAQLWRKRLREG